VVGSRSSELWDFQSASFFVVIGISLGSLDFFYYLSFSGNKLVQDKKYFFKKGKNNWQIDDNLGKMEGAIIFNQNNLEILAGINSNPACFVCALDYL
jgi:hypothetical protein